MGKLMAYSVKDRHYNHNKTQQNYAHILFVVYISVYLFIYLSII